MKLIKKVNLSFSNSTPEFSFKKIPLSFWLWALVLSVLLYIGWKVFLFTTDDAYIAFRYIRNSILGRGYTWNPPPFRPVEGYTSFLWILVLEYIWRLLGIAPPHSANVVALLFSFGTLFYTAIIGLRMRLPGKETRWNVLIIAFALLGVVTNRTFLTWTSSGLETAMFNFFVIAWFYHMVNPSKKQSYWLLVLSVLSVLVYLSRPDGLLFVFCTAFVAFMGLAVSEVRKKDLVSLLPLLVVPVHFLWRKYYYDAWLPNTYYAKHVTAWPESGIRYLASFSMEYSFWLLIPLALLYMWRRRTGPGKKTGTSPGFKINIPLISAIGVVCVHIGYYTFIIGGDHFEYRVYSYLVPLLFIASAYLVAGIFKRKGWAAIALCVFILTTYPIPWTHWYETKDLNTRQETHKLMKPVAPFFPSFLQGYVGLYDGLQSWLVSHYVGLSHQEHKVFLLFVKKEFAQHDLTPEVGERIKWEPNHPITYQRVVGYVGWMLPNVAIIDTAGLNDYVIARTPVEPGEERLMAHEREPRMDYLACLKAEPYVSSQSWKPGPTDKEIIDCENHWWEWADSASH